ncbi:hypothetical protein VTJ04DRAFT_9159 [Mycothermus thermophilus]|uniref:uncharacterized protein n=1 Tax=Humicola insolens TaxID=85995 RepID=UPI003743487F
MDLTSGHTSKKHHAFLRAKVGKPPQVLRTPQTPSTRILYHSTSLNPTFPQPSPPIPPPQPPPPSQPKHHAPVLVNGTFLRHMKRQRWLYRPWASLP